MSLLNIVLSTIIVVSFYLYILSYMINKPINFKDKTTILVTLMLILAIACIFSEFDNFLRIFLNFVATAIASKFILKEKFSKCFIATFFMFVYFFIAEIIASLFLVMLFGAHNLAESKELAGEELINLGISLVALSISSLKSLNTVFRKAIIAYEKTSYNEIIIVMVIVMGILTNNSFIFMGMNFKYTINFILVILFGIITWFLFKEKEHSNHLSMKYDHLFNYIQKYEKQLNMKNMFIHEFNNQLISIKGFVCKTNKKLLNYIDSLLLDSKKTESSVLKGMENIPKGGLKGLIYYKLGDLYEEGIKVLTQISNDPKVKNFSKLDSSILKDIIKIIGVLLDNAIESARVSEKKQIILEIYMKGDQFNLILSNTYSGNINISALDNVGYTTKGNGRGYGLPLINQILNKYNYMEQKREISKEYYSAHLIVNIKNIPTNK